ncbi:MAG: hypothetical protein IH629_07980 [Thermoleophilia bacterium]|nr:hypothetical protein [Thermoleophilia bacterium]
MAYYGVSGRPRDSTRAAHGDPGPGVPDRRHRNGRLHRDGGEVTRYVGHARLTAGSWRVRATHPADEEHAPTAGSWRTFAVK